MNPQKMAILHIFRVAVLLILSKPSLQISTQDSPSYVAAVVEYHPVTDGDDGQMIAEANANNYRTIIKSAVTYNVDIIVFPEFGLTSLPRYELTNREKKFNAEDYRAYYRDTASHIPSPNETVVLCDTDSKYAKSLQSISCAAREYNMYVAVNHHERVECRKGAQDCPRDGFLLYNTNVVFDRKGQLIARYRKYHLFDEPGTNVTARPDISTFGTDFGVTFGQFICFDILNDKPATYFARNPNVTDVLFSSHWYDELPFLTSAQEHAAFAYGADVNLLAAGFSESLTASGGSGIYAGKMGPIKVYHPAQTSNALVVAEVPKLNRRRRVEDVRSNKQVVHVFKQAEVPTISGLPIRPKSPMEHGFREDLSAYTSVVLDPSQGSHITSLCDRGLCCDFHVETTYDEELAKQQDAKHYKYRLVAFSGVRKFNNVSVTMGVEVCALISCAGDSLDDCGRLYPDRSKLVSPTSFDSLIVTRRADLSSGGFFAPTSLSRPLQPLDADEFAYVASGRANETLMMMYLVRPRADLLTFGIYGRRFDRDGQQPTKPEPSAASTYSLSTLVLVATIAGLCFSRLG